jgi:hypothetical protein
VFIDNKKSKILKERFLEVETLAGLHKYEFIYSSKSFLYGLLVSCFSFIGWLLYISRKKSRRILNKLVSI